MSYRTIQEALKIKTDTGRLLHIDTKNIRRPKGEQKKGEQKGETYYIPLHYIDPETKKAHKPRFRFKNQILAGRVKCYDVKNSKDASVSFAALTKEDLSKTDYDESKYDMFLQQNSDFIKLLDAIASDYETICSVDLMDDDKTWPWGVSATLAKKTINHFKQSERKPNETEAKEKTNINRKTGKVPLESAIYRLRLPIHAETRKIGNNKFGSKDLEYIVFDARRKTEDKRSSEIFEVAKLKSKDDKYVDLTPYNVGQFLTAFSMIGGWFLVDTICISKQGISIIIKLEKVYAAPHKTIAYSKISQEDLDEISTFAVAMGNDEDMIENDQIEGAPNKSKPKVNDNETALDEPEPEDNNESNEDNTVEEKKPVETEADDEEDVSEEEPLKPPPKPVVKTPAKAPAKAPAKPAVKATK
jgi:hypothetical protein